MRRQAQFQELGTRLDWECGSHISITGLKRKQGYQMEGKYIRPIYHFSKSENKSDQL